jgi:hypothetical protein
VLLATLLLCVLVLGALLVAGELVVAGEPVAAGVLVVLLLLPQAAAPTQSSPAASPNMTFLTRTSDSPPCRSFATPHALPLCVVATDRVQVTARKIGVRIGYGKLAARQLS